MRSDFDFVAEKSSKPKTAQLPALRPLWSLWLTSFSSVFLAVVLAGFVLVFGLKWYVEYRVEKFFDKFNTPKTVKQ